jgi:transposase
MKRDFQAMEKRRLKAAELLGRGLSKAEVARQVGVHRQSVLRWARELERHGRAGLKYPGRAGRKPKLTAAELRRIERVLKRGPQVLGYQSNLWTLERVAELIERECGVRYHPGHVWRLLRQLGWSCQRPVGKARERNEKAIAHWKKVEWPEVKKTLRDKAGRSSASTRAG